MTVKYTESANDPQKQAQLIDAAVTEKVDGIAVSAPNPDALKDSLQKATDAGIPFITLNSGAEDYQDLGALTHVGQTESIAGRGAGAKLKEDGASGSCCASSTSRPTSASTSAATARRRASATSRTSRSRASTTSRRR